MIIISMKNTDTVIREMEELINQSFQRNIHAHEDDLPVVNGYYTGIALAISALGYQYYFDHDRCWYVIQKDRYKNKPFKEYLNYAARIADGHLRMMMKEPLQDEDSKRLREYSVIEGIDDVLYIFDKRLQWMADNRCYKVVTVKNHDKS